MAGEARGRPREVRVAVGRAEHRVVICGGNHAGRQNVGLTAQVLRLVEALEEIGRDCVPGPV